MGSVFGWMGNVFRFALFLGMTGGLVDATREMYFQAGKARQKGLISLVNLNKQLFPETHIHLRK